MAQQQNLVSWTEPELCHYDYDVTKPWFVYFDFTDLALGITDRKQYRNGINYTKTKDGRLKEGNALKALLKAKLESGWNPVREKRKIAAADGAPATIRDAISKVIQLKQSSLKKKSIRNYNDISNMFLKWATEQGYDKLPLNKFSHQMAQSYLDYLLIDRNYSGKSHNGQLGIMKAFCSFMQARWKYLMPDNPFNGIVMMPEAVGRNVAYTKEEAHALMQYYKLRNVRLYYAAMIMFHCYIRKTELCELRVRDFNWQSGTIIINSDSAKNRKQESVTIPEGLMPVLEDMNLRSYPGNFFVFGALMETCAKKISKPDLISDAHLRCIKEIRERKEVAWQYSFEHESDFEILQKISTDKTFYSWKHTGVVMYWHIVKDVYYMMRQLRHHDMQTTMTYLKSLGLMPNEAFAKARIVL